MEFLKSFFTENAQLKLQKRKIGLDTRDIIYLTYSPLGIIAIATRNEIFLLTNDACIHLAAVKLENVKMYFVESKLWVWMEDLQVWNCRTFVKENQISCLEWCLLVIIKDYVVVGTINGSVNIYNSVGVLVKSLQSLQNPILDIKDGGDLLIVGQESLISCWDWKNWNKIKEITVAGLIGICVSLEKEKIAYISNDWITIHKIHESWLTKKPAVFSIQLKDFKNSFWIGSTLIVVESDKISAFEMKKELVLLAKIQVHVLWDAFLRMVGQEIHLLVFENLEILDLEYSNHEWKKLELKVPDYIFSKHAQDSKKSFCCSNDFFMGEMKVNKQEICGFLSSNKFYSHSRNRSWDLLAFYHDKVCEIWDPWSKEVLKVFDFSEYFVKTDVEKVVLSSKYLLVLGGPRVLVYRFVTSADIELSKRMEMDLERAMESLDNVVESALKEADNVKKILMDSKCKVDEDLQAILETPAAAVDTIAKPISPTNTFISDTSPETNSVYTVGNIITEIYNHNTTISGWHPVCRIVNDQIVNGIIVDFECDLIAFFSDDLEMKICRISNPMTFLSVSVQGKKSISHISFANLFLFNGNSVPL